METSDGVIYFFIFIALSGIPCVYIAVKQGFKGHVSKSWNKTEGYVVENMYSGSDLRPALLKIVQPLSAPSYSANVRYEYQAMNEWRKGRNLYFGNRSHGNRKRVLEQLSRYAPGAIIPVYVNPVNPDESVLIPGVSAPTIGLFSFGIILILVGSWLTTIVYLASN